MVVTIVSVPNDITRDIKPFQYFLMRCSLNTEPYKSSFYCIYLEVWAFPDCLALFLERHLNLQCGATLGRNPRNIRQAYIVNLALSICYSTP